VQSGGSQQKGADLKCDVPDLLLEVVDLKQEVPDLRAGGIPLNLTPVLQPELSMGWVGSGHTKWTHGQLCGFSGQSGTAVRAQRAREWRQTT